MPREELELKRDCRATLIPAGNEVILPEGSRLSIAQALGGSVTVRNEMGLYRIEEADLDALGKNIAREIKSTAPVEETNESFGEGRVWEALKGCYDPEIPVNIVDLGLIYDLQIEDLPEDRHQVKVKMTLTAQGCGMGPAIAADAKAKIEAISEVESADVQIVWDPQWTPHMISPEGREKLGLK